MKIDAKIIKRLNYTTNKGQLLYWLQEWYFAVKLANDFECARKTIYNTLSAIRRRSTLEKPSKSRPYSYDKLSRFTLVYIYKPAEHPF